MSNDNPDAALEGRVERTREFFERPPPEGYIEEWTARLAQPAVVPESDLHSLLIFRLGAEWLALPTGCLVEVTAPQPVHSIPHRTNAALLGLVNIRGQIRLCVSLHEVLGVDRAGVGGQSPLTRMVIIQDRGEQWVFPVEQVERAVRFAGNLLRPAPSTLRGASHHTRAVFEWKGKTVGELDHERLIQSLRGICA